MKWLCEKDRTVVYLHRSWYRDGLLTEAQTDDIWKINRQAREVTHDEPHRRPITALDCVRRVARLLEQLHPVGS